MSDTKLFRIQGDAVEQLQGSSVAIEASLRELIERHRFEALKAFLLALGDDLPIETVMGI